MKLNGATPGAASIPPATPTAGTRPLAQSLWVARANGEHVAWCQSIQHYFGTREGVDPSRPDLQVQNAPNSTSTGILANLTGQFMPMAQNSEQIKFSTSLSELRACDRR